MTDPQTEKLIREALEEGENKIADFNKDLAQFLEDTAGENILQIILRGHLYIERQLTSFLELALKEPREVIKERTSYGNKLSLAYAIGILSKDDKDTCKKIGDIRNSYAHKWGFELTEAEFDKLISTFTGEIIAKHSIPEGKGMLIKDKKHSRDRTKGVGAFINTVAERFEDKELAFKYLEKVREKNPRYIKDQLQIILRETKGIDNEVRTKALAECLKRKLYSATDFGDIIAYVKRQRQVHETVIDKKKEVKTLNRLSEWVLETEAYKRKVDTYTVLMEVE